MAFLDRDGVNIFFQHDGSGPPVLLSNGFSSTTRMWRGQIDAFKDRYSILTWDMRGHGQSDSPEDPAAYSEALTVDDMAAILDHCGFERAVIGGLSLGGYMSMAFAATYPERVAGLMLFDTGPGYKNDKTREDWNISALRQAKEFEKKGLDALGKSEEMQLGGHKSASGLALAARGMLAQKNARVINSLPYIAVPTLVLAGAKDKPFLAGTDYMARKIPDARKVIIPDAGHAANIHQPAAFNEAMDEFLTRIYG